MNFVLPINIWPIFRLLPPDSVLMNAKHAYLPEKDEAYKLDRQIRDVMQLKTRAQVASIRRRKIGQIYLSRKKFIKGILRGLRNNSDTP
jgi:hypothetical protein